MGFLLALATYTNFGRSIYGLRDIALKIGPLQHNMEQ